MARWGVNPLGPYQKVILPWHRPQNPDQHEENIRALERIDWGAGEGTRWGTIVIAASDSTDLNKATADYVCSGGADNATIQAAATTLLTRTNMGRIVFLEGRYVLSAAITLTIPTSTYIKFEGQGNSSYLDGSSAAHVFAINGNGTIEWENFRAAGPSDAEAFLTNSTAVIARFINVGAGIPFLCGSNGPSVIIENCQCTSGWASGAARGIRTVDTSTSYIRNNTIQMAGGRGIDMNANSGYTVKSVVEGNHILGTGVWGIDTNNGTGDSTTVLQTSIVGNKIVGTFTYGIAFNGNNGTLVADNFIDGCTNGISTQAIGITSVTNVFITGNYVRNSTNLGIGCGATTLGTSDVAILFNKISGTSPATAAINVGASCANCAIAFNDTYSGGPVTDSGTSTRREADFFAGAGGILPTGGTTGQALEKTSNTDYAVAWTTIHEVLTGGTTNQVLAKNSGTNFDYSWLDLPIQVKKNSGAVVGTRPILNFIEGSNQTLTVADNAGGNRIDITVSQTSSSGGNASGQLVAIFDGGGTVLAAASYVDIVAPFAGTIINWEVLLDVADTTSTAIWSDSYANYPPTIADIITAAAPMTTTASRTNTSSTLTGWTTGIIAGNIYRIVLNTVTVATKATITVNYTRP